MQHRLLRGRAPAVVESGAVTRALLAMWQDGADERYLAERICRAYLEGLDVDGAALSLLTATADRSTLFATDPVADLVEDLQATLAEGACVDAAATGRPVLVTDLRDAAVGVRWPLFAPAVAEQTPVRALFALPLNWGAVNLGVLDLYRGVPGGLSAGQWRDALAAADAATLMLLARRTDPDGDGRPDGHRDGGAAWLEDALGYRAEVHQAVGMVLVQLDISAADALARLRAYAFVHGRLLIDVARDVVQRRLVFTDDMR